MSWIVITAADLDATKMAALVSALRSAALSDDQADPVEAITATVVDRIRRKIAACPTNSVDDDATKIPLSLKSLACRMIVREAKDRLEMDLTTMEVESWKVDERELDAIAACRLPIDTSDNATAAPVQSTQPGPTITKRPKQFGRNQQEGA